jgi:dihydroorotase
MEKYLLKKWLKKCVIILQFEKRGYIKEGYFADLVLVNPNNPWTVNKDNILYKCEWSPFEGSTFKSRVTHTILNGTVVYENAKFSNQNAAMRLTFNR